MYIEEWQLAIIIVILLNSGLIKHWLKHINDPDLRKYFIKENKEK